MARKYKLRFGDGTTLALDEDGLRTWISRGKVDDETTVQPPGSKSWLRLPDFLAKQGAGARGGPSAGDAGALRLAAVDDAEPVDDEVYEGGGPGAFSIVWLWARRLVLTAALLFAVGTAMAWWPVWVPKATELSYVVFTLIHDRLNPPATSGATLDQERERIARDALQTAAEQLPHLQADTIQRVMQTSFVGVLDPAEVFRRAQEAVQRGLPSLSREEAQEVRDLKAALMFALRPEEKDRLREYEQIRGSRVTLPFEDREALSLTARGARALSPEKRQRLQALLGKAAAAGLSAGSATAAVQPATMR